MSKPTHFKCPNCGSYVRAPVKETRNEFDGVFRRRRCEQCKIIIETLEQIKGFHKLGYKIKWNDNHGELVRCKDCKRHLECDYWIENGDDWYCADGEREDNDA